MKRHAFWLTDREHRCLNWLATMALLAFVLLPQPWLADKRQSRLLLCALGIGFAFAFWVVGRMRHRLWAAFASFLMLFAPWDFAYIANALYLVFAFWLLWRAGRALTEEPPAPT